jgi:hypothetical protein
VLALEKLERGFGQVNEDLKNTEAEVALWMFQNELVEKEKNEWKAKYQQLKSSKEFKIIKSNA